MQTTDFNRALAENAPTIDRIKHLAHELHTSVNQHYDKNLPYSFHLDMVANNVCNHAAEICDNTDDIIPILFGAWFHDSIEDARLTYNNVLRLASQLMDERQALMATEIVYALTNEKGRNRAERANDKYYAGIRATPYAPMVKVADRLANVAYSCNHSSNINSGMRQVYAAENPHFISALTVADTSDPRLCIPKTMIAELDNILSKA